MGDGSFNIYRTLFEARATQRKKKIGKKGEREREKEQLDSVKQTHSIYY
jgi:hypothetical protein